MSPYEALKTGTYNAAECLSALDEFGTVAPNRRADLVLLENNPLEDIKNLTKRAGVMVRGRWFSEEDLQRRLEEIVSSYTGVIRIESKGELVLSAHYDLLYNGIPFGEERFELFDLDSNRYELISQTVTDRPYYTQTSVRMTLDGSFMCDHIEYLNETSTGDNSLELDRKGDSLHVRGTLKGDLILDKRRPLDQRMFMNPPRAGVCVSDVPVMAAFLPLGRILANVSMDDSLKAQSVSQQLSLPYDLIEETIAIRRTPDSVKLEDDEGGNLRMFSYDILLPHAAIHSELATDEEGTVVSLKVEQQIGILSIQLVSMEQNVSAKSRNESP